MAVLADEEANVTATAATLPPVVVEIKTTANADNADNANADNADNANADNANDEKDQPKKYTILDNVNDNVSDNDNDAKKNDIKANEESAKKLVPRKLTLSAAEGVLAGLPEYSAADDMAAVMGISQFYSLHVMNVCEGTFAPNVTFTGAWRNVSSCTVQLNAQQLNISQLIDNELNANFVDGGSLERIGGSKSLQNALNRIPTIGLVLAVFYILACCAAGLCLLLTGASLVTRATHGRETVLANMGAASGAALALLIAGLVSAVAAKSTVDSINRLGKDTIGMEAVHGGKFESLTWAAFGMMVVVALFWLHELHGDAKKAAAAAAASKKAAPAAK